jgi:perosamine synthetase
VTATTLATSVRAAIESVIGSARAGLHEPRLSSVERSHINACLDSTFVSSAGEYVNRLEDQIADFADADHVIAVVNGTAALHVSLILAGVQAGDEVLVPALSFVATANAVSYCGATPHFVDSSYETLGMDPTALRSWLERTTEKRNGTLFNKDTGRPIRAVVPMHTFGHPCDLNGLKLVASEFSLELVEDAAESLGSWYEGTHTGTIGRFGILSFNGNKIVTTGGGGAILTNDSELADRARHLTTTAKIPHRWDYVHDEIGFNYRMPNLNAALGCAQLERLPDFLLSKRRLFECYREAFDGFPHVTVVSEPENSQSNYWLQALLLDKKVVDQRDSVLEATNSAGFMTRPCWKLTNSLLPYLDCPRAPLPVAEDLERRLINIPSSAELV